MPGQRLSMRQDGEGLYLKHVCGYGGYPIGAMIGISRYTVAEYLRRAAVMLERSWIGSVIARSESNSRFRCYRPPKTAKGHLAATSAAISPS